MFFGDDIMIQSGDTFKDYGIEAGARLQIKKKPATFEEVVSDVIKLNPDLSKKNQENLNKKTGPHLFWRGIKITQLPESFGDLIIEGDLYLGDDRYDSQYKLTSLPKVT